MKRTLIAAGIALALSGTSALAQAVYASPYYDYYDYAAPTYAAPAPVYGAPAPVYVAPAPTMVQRYAPVPQWTYPPRTAEVAVSPPLYDYVPSYPARTTPVYDYYAPQYTYSPYPDGVITIDESDW
jgi:hypothetical protein